MSNEIRTRKATLEEWHVTITSYSLRDKYTMKCLHCQIETQNKKYCSRSCAAVVNNTIYPKRELESQNKCKNCGKKYSRKNKIKQYKLCQECYFDYKNILFGNKTKLEILKESVNYASKHRYEKIRQHAKRTAKRNNWNTNTCEKCGYDKHTEICHIKPIYEFDDTDLINKINCKENIRFLCPNCHWELDNLK